MLLTRSERSRTTWGLMHLVTEHPPRRESIADAGNSPTDKGNMFAHFTDNYALAFAVASTQGNPSFSRVKYEDWVLVCKLSELPQVSQQAQNIAGKLAVPKT